MEPNGWFLCDITQNLNIREKQITRKIDLV